MLINENTVIALFNGNLISDTFLRVLWISNDLKVVFVVDITDKSNMQLPYKYNYDELISEINEERGKILELEPDLRITSPDESYLDKYKADRDKNWAVISEIVSQEPEIYSSRQRSSMISDVMETTGRSKKEIYRLLKRYWFYGKNRNGLLKNYFDCGALGIERNYAKKPGPKSINTYLVTKKDKEIFEKAIEKYHKKGEMDLTATHSHMIEEFYHSGYYRKNGVMVPIIEPNLAPTRRQFMYWYRKNHSLLERYKKKYGNRKAEMDYRPLQGDATERATSVGYLYEVDSTPADIILVTEDRETIIGTPTLYIVKDVFSRIIAGFHVSLSPPSGIEQIVALENAASSKKDYCKQFGIEIDDEDWPCKNLPKFLNGDRGELKSKLLNNFVNINVDVANAPSYRGDLKPYVEQHFRITNKKIRELFVSVGAKPPQMINRGDKDPTPKAALTIYEFTQFMILHIITFNKSALSPEFFVTKDMFNEKVGLTPIEVWNWGKRKKLLHEIPRDVLRHNLLPKVNGKVTRFGIQCNGMDYTSDLGLKEGWFVSERIEGMKVIEASFDPRNVSRIFIRLKNGKLEACNLTNRYKDYEGLHLEEVKAIQKYKKEELKRQENLEKQHYAELHAFSNELAKNAQKETKDVTKGMSKYERQKDKRTAKKSESRKLGSKNAWTAVTKSESNYGDTGEIVSFPIPVTNKIENNDLIKEQFGLKNRERRRNRESLE